MNESMPPTSTAPPPSGPRRQRRWPLAARWDAPLLGLAHLALGLIYYARGLRYDIQFVGSQWDHYWQVIPLVDLQQAPWQSLWQMHAQPPGYSLWGLLWLRLFPEQFPQVLQFPHIVLGALVVMMTYGLARGLSGRRSIGVAAGVLVALNPALLFFESHPLYEMVVLALVTATAWLLWRALASGRRRWLVAYALALAALALTRSMYHLVFVAGALAFAWPLWRRLRLWQVLALALLALAPPLAWYAKNKVQYDFFGASSWFGLGWYACVYMSFSDDELAGLAERGLISKVSISHKPYRGRPADYRSFGFTRDSELPLLARNDFHNINIVEVSRVYGEDAWTLVRLEPLRYLHAIHRSYRQMSVPPSRFHHLTTRMMRHVFWEPAYAHLLYGLFISEIFFYTLGWELGSMFYFILPLLLAAGAAWVLATARRQRRRAAAGRSIQPATLARPWLMSYLLFISVYVLAIGTLFEFGENVRFRFAIEPLHFTMALVVIHAYWRRRKASRS